MWELPDDKFVRLEPLDVRAVFCAFYEHMARLSADYKRLSRMRLSEQRSFLLVGPRGRSIFRAVGARDVARLFEQMDAPFGHEMVLFTMLTFEHLSNSEWEDVLPWRVHWRRLFGTQVAFDRSAYTRQQQ